MQSNATKKPSLVTKYVDQLNQGYQYTSNSGTQVITPGTIVYVDRNDPTGKNGKYYLYLGQLGTNGLKPQPINLSPLVTNYGITVALQNNIPEWAPFTNSSVLADLPDFATVKSTGENQGTGSSSTAVGAIFVLNTINASVDAHASASTLDSGVGVVGTNFGGGVLINALNISAINATNTSTVTASDGRTGPTTQSPGTGLAVNAMVATNNVLGSTQAYSSGGSITSAPAAASMSLPCPTPRSTPKTIPPTPRPPRLASCWLTTIGIAPPLAGFRKTPSMPCSAF